MLLKVFYRYTLIQVLQKAKATFSRKEREQDGIFNPSFHLVSNKPFLKGRHTDIPGLGSQSILLLERYSHSVFPHAWAFPPGSEILPKMEKMEQYVPSDDSAAPNSSRVSAKCPSLESSYVVTPRCRTQKYHLVLTKGRLGGEAENSACLWDPRLPHISSLPAQPSLNLASPQ